METEKLFRITYYYTDEPHAVLTMLIKADNKEIAERFFYEPYEDATEIVSITEVKPC